eukprot:scaffold130676_cov57-Phaeocystis_antarctica.AAC.1
MIAALCLAGDVWMIAAAAAACTVTADQGAGACAAAGGAVSNAASSALRAAIGAIIPSGAAAACGAATSGAASATVESSAAGVCGAACPFEQKHVSAGRVRREGPGVPRLHGARDPRPGHVGGRPAEREVDEVDELVEVLRLPDERELGEQLATPLQELHPVCVRGRAALVLERPLRVVVPQDVLGHGVRVLLHPGDELLLGDLAEEHERDHLRDRLPQCGRQAQLAALGLERALHRHQDLVEHVRIAQTRHVVVGVHNKPRLRLRELRKHDIRPLLRGVPRGPVVWAARRALLIGRHLELPHVGILPVVPLVEVVEVVHDRGATRLGDVQVPQHAALHRRLRVLVMLRHAGPLLARAVIVPGGLRVELDLRARCRLERVEVRKALGQRQRLNHQEVRHGLRCHSDGPN